MGNYTKVKNIMLYVLNNAEYLSFMNHVLDLANGNSGGGDSESPDEISLLTGSDGIPELGLDAYLAELEKENNAYDRLSQQRVQNRTTSKKESGANLRKRIDVYYDDLTLLAQSYGVAKPSEKATAFIAALNQLIAETTAAYNQRMASAKKPAPAPEPTPEPTPGGDSESPDEI